MSEVEDFRRRLVAEWPELAENQKNQLCQYYQMVLEESSQQNLTKLLSPDAFLEGHILDVKAALSSGLIEYPAIDLGSGVGVPGLVAAVVSGEKWILAESENQKAEFLKRAAGALSLPNVQVYYGRAEELLRKTSVNSIVARAVGPVSRIFAWIKDCSTWNNLVLFKGPKWEEEWTAFGDTNFRGKLQIAADYPYLLGTDRKKMRLIKLIHVPRGTNIRKKA